LPHKEPVSLQEGIFSHAYGNLQSFNNFILRLEKTFDEGVNVNQLSTQELKEYVDENLRDLRFMYEKMINLSLDNFTDIRQLKNSQKLLEDSKTIPSTSKTFSASTIDKDFIEAKSKDYIIECQISQRMVEVLEDIEEALDDPPSFEAALSNFLTLLEDLYQREDQREVYFSDLLSMLRMALSSIECDDLTKGGIEAIREALSYLDHEVTESQLKELRQKFRKNAVDILRPFNPQHLTISPTTT